jgi:hypothetical protein
MRWALQQSFTGGTITPDLLEDRMGTSTACILAAGCGQTLTLQWLKEIGEGNWNRWTCTCAAGSGNIVHFLQ